MNTLTTQEQANKISVIIPLYNKANYICPCLDSVLQQTVQPGEIIVIDDGSTDGSADLVERTYGEKLKLIRQTNGGESIARNTGIENAKLDYIALLDADDVWCPEYLDEICKLILDYNDCEVFATAYQLVYSDHKESARYVDIEKDFRGKLKNYFRHSLGSWSILTSSSTVIHKALFQRTGTYTPNLKLGADTDLWCRLALKANIAFSNKPLAMYYCFNESSVTNEIIPETELVYSKQLTNALKNNEVPSEYKSDVRKFIAQGLQYLVREHAKRGNYAIALKFLRDKRLYYFFSGNTLKMLLALITPRKSYEYLKTLKKI